MAVPTEESFPQLVRTTNSPSLFLPRNFPCLSHNSFDPRFPSASLSTWTWTAHSTSSC